MEWVYLAVFLSVFQAAFGFNIDPVVWKTLNSAGDGDGFGYKVVQRQSSSLLVSAPFSKNRNKQIYKCSTESCSPMSIDVPDADFGLTMTNDPKTGKTIVCGPTITRECTHITLYNGVCREINEDDKLGKYVPSSEDCAEAADVAFLLDGSGSVRSSQFKMMKTFVKDMIRSLLLVGRYTKFAVTQFSTGVTTHYHFDTFKTSRSWETQIDHINQQRGFTHTATAITHVVEQVFSRERGSRPKVNKFLIVITDGASNDGGNLHNAAALAASKGIVSFAIGVGNAFSNPNAIAELETIATKSTDVFRVDNFQALDGIKDALKNSIKVSISIEGSQTSGDSLKLEMAQEGFSAAYVPGGGFQMAAVGAFQWKGSYQEVSAEGQREDINNLTDIDPDSYLGYSMAIAIGESGTVLTVLGAPRYKHMGMVMVFNSTKNIQNKTIQKIDPSTDPQFQIGAYFGAEVCTMDVDQSGYTDIILISAPTFTERDREGRVYVCSLTGGGVECPFDGQSVLKGVAGERGRFGSSLAPLPDLNRDGFNDLAVGAPLENDGQGSIYIFHGDGRRTINPMYSQRIPGSDVQPGLRFFGLSISQSSFDLSGDGLPDLAVGSKGAVLLLRSKPIVMVKAQVTFSPNKIPTNNPDCNSPSNTTANVCFIMTSDSVETAQAQINYTLTLDSNRPIPNNRAYTKTPKQRVLFNTFTLDMEKPHCFSQEFNIEACPVDALKELSNELRFTFEGASSDKLSLSLAQKAQKTTYHPLGFQINCGTDDLCTDNLKVDFNFTSSTDVKVGIDELLNVMVSVENRDEDSYNSRVTLTYPPGLSYRKFTRHEGRVECNSIDSEDGSSQGKSDCTIDKPIFKTNAKAVFTVSYGIVTNISEPVRKMLITANATSENQHSQESELYQQKEIDVKYSVSLSISNPSSLYTNFTFGRNDLQTPLPQAITVKNTGRALNVTVVIKVPVRLGDKDIWMNPIEILGCDRLRHDDTNTTTLSDFVDSIKQDLKVDCSVARCAVFRCNVFMVKDQRDVYHISANLSSGWIEQIGLQSAKFSLISTATLDYDRDQYILISAESNNNPLVRKIVATVEVYPVTDLTNAIIGGSVGGLVLLALITAGLLKVGFFKSPQYTTVAQGGEE